MAVRERQRLISRLIYHLIYSGEALAKRSFVRISPRHFNEAIRRSKSKIVATTRAFDYLLHHTLPCRKQRCDGAIHREETPRNGRSCCRSIPMASIFRVLRFRPPYPENFDKSSQRHRIVVNTLL
ncbi:hypothetical protein MPTK1_8g14910 [Marchantia polymorpha subsp. ruderalis]|nr:hypothetical protein Mp_8g14910 [Marchantia polymorpha subsp. ruderalis]